MEEIESLIDKVLRNMVKGAVKMFKKLVPLVVLSFMLMVSGVYAKSNFIKSEVPEEVAVENNASYDHQYQIIIENEANGAIYRLDPDGTETVLGNVVVPADATYTAADGFWAAQYTRANNGNTGSVVATAVNAIHLRVGPEEWYDPEEAQNGRDSVWKPQLITLMPDREYYKSGPGPHPGRIATNIPGGKKLFGGVSAPYVGSAVYYKDGDGNWQPLEQFYRSHTFQEAPAEIMIEVAKPKTTHGKIKEITFENKVGGDITVHYENGFTKAIATVLQRVEGTGRFGGSEYAEVGYVRANHGGVLDLSTSPYAGFTWDQELLGGFQIVPANHAVYSRHFLDLNYIERPQYMIVGPLGSTPDRLLDPVYFDENGISYEPHLEAVAPLFGSYIKPKYVTNHDMIPSHVDKSKIPENVIKGQSTHYKFSFDDGNSWVDPTPITGSHDDSIIDVTHIKVYLNY